MSKRESVGPRNITRSNFPFSHTLFSLYRRNPQATRSILIFCGCIVIFWLAYSTITASRPMAAFSAFIANATGFILNTLSFDTQVIGTSVASTQFNMTIAEACTGLIPIALVVSAIIAYPSSLLEKGKGIILGTLGLSVINLGRMVGLFIVGTYLPNFFNMAHYVVGQSLMILLAIALWLFWEERGVNGKQQYSA